MTKKRISAADLIRIHGKSTAWFSLLNEEDQKFILDVVDELIKRPDISLASAAQALIKELKIHRNTETVARTLKGFIRNAK